MLRNFSDYAKFYLNLSSILQSLPILIKRVASMERLSLLKSMNCEEGLLRRSYSLTPFSRLSLGAAQRLSESR